MPYCDWSTQRVFYSPFPKQRRLPENCLAASIRTSHFARNNVIIMYLLHSRIDVNLRIYSSRGDILFAKPVSSAHSHCAIE